jgi:hypothetical protein
LILPQKSGCNKFDCNSTLYNYKEHLIVDLNSSKLINNTDNKKNKKIVIIGGVAAGTSAASKARRVDPNAQITILQDEPLVSYGACGMPY